MLIKIKKNFASFFTRISYFRRIAWSRLVVFCALMLHRSRGQIPVFFFEPVDGENAWFFKLFQWLIKKLSSVNVITEISSQKSVQNKSLSTSALYVLIILLGKTTISNFAVFQFHRLLPLIHRRILLKFKVLKIPSSFRVFQFLFAVMSN
jgi:hypothetical protein